LQRIDKGDQCSGQWVVSKITELYVVLNMKSFGRKCRALQTIYSNKLTHHNNLILLSKLLPKKIVILYLRNFSVYHHDYLINLWQERYSVSYENSCLYRKQI